MMISAAFLANLMIGQVVMLSKKTGVIRIPKGGCSCTCAAYHEPTTNLAPAREDVYINSLQSLKGYPNSSCFDVLQCNLKCSFVRGQ